MTGDELDAAIRKTQEKMNALRMDIRRRNPNVDADMIGCLAHALMFFPLLPHLLVIASKLNTARKIGYLIWFSLIQAVVLWMISTVRG